MMGLGVADGAIITSEKPASKPGTPDSATVGTPGNSGVRCLPVTASALSLPDNTTLRAEEAASMPPKGSPLIIAIAAGALPLNWMVTKSSAAA